MTRTLRVKRPRGRTDDAVLLVYLGVNRIGTVLGEYRDPWDHDLGLRFRANTGRMYCLRDQGVYESEHEAVKAVLAAHWSEAETEQQP